MTASSVDSPVPSAPATPVGTTAVIAGDVRIAIRPITPDDFAAARRFHDALRPGTRYFRYGHTAFRLTDAQIAAACAPSPDEEVFYVAVRPGPAGEEIVGAARFMIDAALEQCEFATVVLDGLQGQGIGEHLMHTLIDDARARGLARIHGTVLSTNRAMLHFVRRLGFEVREAGPLRRVELPLR